MTTIDKETLQALVNGDPFTLAVHGLGGYTKMYITVNDVELRAAGGHLLLFVAHGESRCRIDCCGTPGKCGREKTVAIIT